MKKIAAVLFVILMVFSLAACGKTDTTVSSEIENNTASGDASSDETENVSPGKTGSVSSNEPSETDSIPQEYKSALKKAEFYSDMMHMSKAALFDQLVSEYGEQFSKEAAQYAIDNLAADWNANALAKAADYAKIMQMSKAGIYDQLTSEYGEKFTPEEAQYAVDNVKADWKANALAKAKYYQEMMNMSPSAIYDQLVSEYGEKFTPEEAQYAIDNLS